MLGLGCVHVRGAAVGFHGAVGDFLGVLLMRRTFCCEKLLGGIDNWMMFVTSFLIIGKCSSPRIASGIMMVWGL